MEKALLVQDEVENKRVSTWDVYVQELKKVSSIAIPMVVATLSQHLSRVVSMMMVGHLGELSLSGAAVATSLTNVTGFSLLFGLAGGLETSCGQAFGAGEYHKLGSYTFGGALSLIVVCLPISLLWIFMDKLLIFIGQDHSISSEAGRYAVWLIPTLFPYAILQALMRYLQTQSLIFPIVISSIAALFFHVPVCWFLVFCLNMGNSGAALAIGLSYWFNIAMLVFYVKRSAACQRTRISYSTYGLSSIREFFKFGIPSALMACLEWWTCEIIVLLSGLLPNPQVETSVLSIGLLIASFHYYIPHSVGVAASTRVSNELGAGNPKAARTAFWAVMILSTAEAITTTITLLSSRHVLGYAFSNEKGIVIYLRDLTPLVCLLLVMDSIQAVLSGIARGSGRQHLGAFINLGAFYLFGIPLSLVMGFVWHYGGRGLWMGLNAGSTVQALLFFLLTAFTNWEKQVVLARGRIFDTDQTLTV